MNQLQSIIKNIQAIFNVSVSIIIGLAIIVFIVGLLKYGFSSDNSEREKSKNLIVNGVIIIFVMISIWGLVTMVKTTFNLQEKFPSNSTVNSSSLIK